ncbi:MAG: nuclear transport factor 2 family protein [Alphaproteobacteria bacterium]|nr:nuclear transport factor 2 family protein [Alphaproteobacteria bacterium]
MAVAMVNPDLDNPALDPELRKIDDLFVRSYFGKDLETLRTILDPGFTFLDGADGREVKRPDFDRTCLAQPPFRNLVHDQTHTRIDGDSAAVAARNRYERLIDGTWVAFNTRYVDVFRRVDGRWRCFFATVYKVAK